MKSLTTTNHFVEISTDDELQTINGGFSFVELIVDYIESINKKTPDKKG